MISPLRREHVGAVAAMHCATLTGLLTRLGPRAAEAFYIGCTRTPLAIGFVSLEGSVVRGFVLGSLHPDRLQAEVLRRNPIPTLMGIGVGILTRPTSLRWLISSLRGPDQGSFDAAVPSLVYLGVATDGRGRGAGTQLVTAFNEAMRAASADGYDLSVDEENLPAIAFYERLGFHRQGEYTEFGVRHRRYRITL